MGVTGLWNVVHPCARPIKIETLNKKRLAVDASIWIYQFLKAVRDKEGNALRNSHVVGFFRRICKLLYLGIKPVFVFDGGAPVLKRQTINNRKRRREGRRDDAVKTAGKLLALQMQRAAEDEEQKRKDARRHTPPPVEEEPLPENLVYAEEIALTPQERQKNRKFKKQDAYHLPNLNANLAEMGQPNDPRIMSLEELQHYANQFQSGEDINVYDFSKIDFDSPFFTSLPASDRYNILNAARLRSRLRLGYSKEQLDTMFPNRMEFSRFQIERVRERNELTQRLMHINNSGGDLTFGISGVNRVAGEKGREYVLVKNDGVEGGWALGVVSNEGKKEQPIDVDAVDKESDVEMDSDEEDFEDVPIEGVNRLPRKAAPSDDFIRRDTGRRQAFYGSRRRKVNRRPKSAAPADADSLFVQSASEAEEEEWEEVPIEAGVERDTAMADEDADLQAAIAMSMQQNQPTPDKEDEGSDDDMREVFQQRKAPEVNPFAKGSGKFIAHTANARAFKAAPKPFEQGDSDESDDAMDLQAALAESRNSKHKPSRPPPRQPSPTTASRAAGFDGPLPFEKLSLGTSLLGKKKMEKIEADQAGGFERDLPKESEKKKKKDEPKPLPPWFAGRLEEDMAAQEKLEREQRQKDAEAAKREAERSKFLFEDREAIRRQGTREIIDLEAPNQSQDVIVVDSEPDDDEVADVVGKTLEDEVDEEPDEVPMTGDLADRVKIDPPQPDESLQVDIRDEEAIRDAPQSPATSLYPEPKATREASVEHEFEWEDSDNDNARAPTKSQNQSQKTTPVEANEAESEEEDFEDVVLEEPPSLAPAPPPETPQVPRISLRAEDSQDTPFPPLAGSAHQTVDLTMDNAQDEDIYSDPEDEELMLQLAQEEEEHARFASTLNNNRTTLQQNIANYESELKQLRNQQKKDRRDADEVTQTMITECQQLLALFGLPYITAPMEAEAQCAELVHLGLVDGIVTDDSDVFLFGGTRVYKNVFNQAKFVECYLTSDLESEFGLTRRRLISIAQLLGSDYTEGLPGIGPVTALEILSEFDDLGSFKEWWTAVQQGSRPKDADASNAFRKKFRRNTAKVFLPVTFPDPRVEAAYLEPEVDNDPSDFAWGVPDLAALRSFLMSTIGWTNERVDEVLVPVIRDLNRREQEGTQSNITKFFGGGVGAGGFAPRKRAEGGSKRLESALTRIGDKVKGRNSVQEIDGEAEAPQERTKAASKSKSRSAKRTAAVASEDGTTGEEDEEFVEPRKKARKVAGSRGRRKVAATLEEDQ
jgi:DNA excision repair protein ERCC-5